jgi:hypothetical protein
MPDSPRYPGGLVRGLQDLRSGPRAGRQHQRRGAPRPGHRTSTSAQASANASSISDLAGEHRAELIPPDMANIDLAREQQIFNQTGCTSSP